jgi:hypothetical protein
MIGILDDMRFITDTRYAQLLAEAERRRLAATAADTLGAYAADTLAASSVRRAASVRALPAARPSATERTASAADACAADCGGQAVAA